jgi:hypothetical protein
LASIYFVSAAHIFRQKQSTNPSSSTDLTSVDSPAGKPNQMKAATATTLSKAETPGPLAVCVTNPRYFCDPSGNVVYLSGTHTWSNLMEDRGTIGTPPEFDYNGYMTFMASHGYNWMRGWTAEMTHLLPSDDGFEDVIAPPFKWVRPGPRTANDDGLQYDFTQLDPNYFSRMRARIIQASQNGIYVSVMLFNGYQWWLDIVFGDGNPMESGNNVNSVSCPTTCPINLSLMPAQVLTYEKTYVHRVIDTVHDLPNVMYEISNESGCTQSDSWQAVLIAEVNNYERTTYNSHHPIGYTSDGSGCPDTTIYNSAADWVSPNNGGSGATPGVATGQCPEVTGIGGASNPASPNCKVVINDTDHSFGWPSLQSAGASGQTNWVWENFTNGNGVAFMDPYLVLWPVRNECTGAPVGGDPSVCSGLDSQWNTIRSAIADVAAYAKKIDLKDMTPQGSLSTSGFCLANPGSQYLVFSASNSFNLMTVAGSYTFELFNASMHTLVQTGNVKVGNSQVFTAPFSGETVLWLYK